MSNYLDTLNREVSTLSSEISNVENKDSIILNSRRNAIDITNISSYINNLIVKSFTSLCSKERFPYDAVESGISGLTLQTYPEAQGNNSFNSELFWKNGATPEQGRPCTIKESFDYILANMFERVVEIRNSTANLDELWDGVGCLTKDLTKLKRDIFGDQYNFDCTIDKENVWPISRHVYEILTQLTTGHTNANINSLDVDFNIGAVAYPQLSLIYNVPTLHQVLTAGNVSNLEAKVGKLTIVDTNNATVFSLPQTDGTANQVLKTNGAGVVSWASDSTDIPNATPSIAGKVEMATTIETANASLTGSSGARLAIGPETLATGITLDGTLRTKIKQAALQQIQESSIDELEDVDTSTVPPSGGQVLMWNQEDEKWKPETLDESSTEYLGSIGQGSTLGDVSTDAISTHTQGNSLNFDMRNNKWFSGYFGGSNNINLYYSWNDEVKEYQLPAPASAGALAVRKIPYTFCSIGEKYSSNNFPSDYYNNVGSGKGEVSESELVGILRRRTSKYVSSNNTNEILWKNLLGVIRNDLLVNTIHSVSVGQPIDGTLNETFVNSYMMSTAVNKTNKCPVQKSGLSPIIVFGPYAIGDKLYICPEFLLHKMGINYGIGICLASSFFDTDILESNGGQPAMTMLEIANSTLDSQADYGITNYSSADTYGFVNVGHIANDYIIGDMYLTDINDTYFGISNQVCCKLLDIESDPSTRNSSFHQKVSSHPDYLDLLAGTIASIQHYALTKYTLVLGEIKI